MSEATTLRVDTNAGTALRYAEASGDHNPIHLDRAAALAAGLPGPILHGLYTMAQAARCACAAGDDAGGAWQLRSLSVQFRGVGLPGRELVVTASPAAADGEHVDLELAVHQDRRRLIRRGRARLVLAGRDAGD